MRKVITTVFMLAAFFGGFSVYAAPGDNCTAVYNTPPFEPGGNGPNVEPANDTDSILLLCNPATNGCDSGERCDIVCRRGYMETCVVGREYSGHCIETDYCCRNTGQACHSALMPCCNAAETCNHPPEDFWGECSSCSDEGESCTADLDCCATNRDGREQVCNIQSGTCVQRPPEPAYCSPGLIANGEICDWEWWSGDNSANRCSNCASGTSEADANGNQRCVGLPNGATCSNECACASGTCNDNVCVDEGACINNYGDTGCLVQGCCSVIRSTPAVCGPDDRCIPACMTAAEGDECDSIADCCYANTGLTCYRGQCVTGSTVGGECSIEGACAPSGCGLGEMCVNGRCNYSPDCMVSLEVLDYTGPIVDFSDLLSRVYFFMYPAGIAVGLFFIAKAGYTIMMSEGNPAKVSEGKDELTSAVIGTIFILLSLVILRVIISALLGATI